MVEPWVEETQKTLGTLITKPKLGEKYLRKPPFRFLHDALSEVVRATGFGQGLYNEAELDAGNISDKQAKLDFLNKMVPCVAFALGEKLDVSANKIVAGLEPEKTNAFLVKLFEAATTKLDASPDAVMRVVNGETVVDGGGKEKKEKKEKKADKEEEEGDGKKEKKERKKKEDPDEAPAGGDDEEEARRKKEEEKRRREEKKRRAEAKAKEEEEAAAAAGDVAAAEEEDKRRKKEEERARRDEEKKQKEATRKEEKRRAEEEKKRAAEEASAAAAEEDRRASAAPKPVVAAPMTFPDEPPVEERNTYESATNEMVKHERPLTAGRKPPKITSKVKEQKEEPGMQAGGAPVAAQIFTEGGMDMDDEDMFIKNEEVQKPAADMLTAGGDQGKLVRELLQEKEKAKEAEKEEVKPEEEEKKGGIRMGKLKRKKDDATQRYSEVDVMQLSQLTQSLCQTVNPLGKSVDMIYQDIASMSKELDQWRAEYRSATERQQVEREATEKELAPLHAKVAGMDDQIADMASKIAGIRTRIHQNDLTINQLLETIAYPGS